MAIRRRRQKRFHRLLPRLIASANRMAINDERKKKDFVTRNDEEGEIDLNFRDSNKSVISHTDTSNLKLFPASVDLAGERKSFTVDDAEQQTNNQQLI